MIGGYFILQTMIGLIASRNPPQAAGSFGEKTSLMVFHRIHRGRADDNNYNEDPGNNQ